MKGDKKTIYAVCTDAGEATYYTENLGDALRRVDWFWDTIYKTTYDSSRFVFDYDLSMSSRFCKIGEEEEIEWDDYKACGIKTSVLRYTKRDVERLTGEKFKEM